MATPAATNSVPPPTTASARHTPIPTPAPTPGTATGAPADTSRGVKREREDSVSHLNGAAQGQTPTPGVTVVTNGWVKPPPGVLNAKAGSAGVRPRPIKKQRVVCVTIYAPVTCWQVDTERSRTCRVRRETSLCSSLRRMHDHDALPLRSSADPPVIHALDPRHVPRCRSFATSYPYKSTRPACKTSSRQRHQPAACSPSEKHPRSCTRPAAFTHRLNDDMSYFIHILHSERRAADEAGLHYLYIE